MSPKLIQEKEITPASFQMTPGKSSAPSLRETRRSLPAAFLKKFGQAWTLFPCWLIWVWNRALYQMKYLDPANCFLALSSCRSSWFYNTQSESLFYILWKTLSLGLYTATFVSFHLMICCARFSCILQITEWSIIILCRGSLPATIRVKFFQFFASVGN